MKGLSSKKRKRSRRILDKKTHKMFLFQICYYPLVKKILSHLLCYSIRKRYRNTCKSVVTIQSYWRFSFSQGTNDEMDICRDNEAVHLDLDDSEEEEIVFGNVDRIENFDSFLCPSPAVLFRGKLLTTPRRIPSNGFSSTKASTCIAPLRCTPSISTPIRTSRAARELSQEKSLSAINSTPIRQKKEIPLDMLPDNSKRSPIRIPIPNLSLSQDPKKRPQRIIRKETPKIEEVSKSSEQQRQFSDDTELALLTQQNTRMNSGYQNCEILVTDSILERERPESPSNKFVKSLASKTKWADLYKAREITQKAWEALHSQVSPNLRKVKWKKSVNFIDETEDDIPVSLNIGASPPRKPAIQIRSPTRSPSVVKNATRYKLNVKRIFYAPELTPVDNKKYVSKKQKK